MIKIPSINCKWVDDINYILRNALDSVDPFKCVSKVINLDENILRIAESQINLRMIKNVYVIGVGKAVIPMAVAVEKRLGSLISGGFLISKHHIMKSETQFDNKIQVHFGGHPIPDLKSIDAAEKLEKFIQSINENDLIINLISGGGSALMTLPYADISINDIQDLTHILLGCGAAIQEINTIRKHIDRIKGGGLCRMTYPTKMISLILSDVVGNDISMIASGPSAGDETTFQNCMEIFEKYNIQGTIPKNILNHIKKGMAGNFSETVKPGDDAVKNVPNIIVGSLSTVMRASEKYAQELGYHTFIHPKYLLGEAGCVGRDIASFFLKKIKNDPFQQGSICFIAGGETTVTLSGNGRGGRNQEIALGAIETLNNHNDCCLICIATDGEDGPTDAAGAFITGISLERAKEIGLDPQQYLINNDSYTFFDNMGNLIKIGPTGTNVNDLLLFFKFV